MSKNKYTMARVGQKGRQGAIHADAFGRAWGDQERGDHRLAVWLRHLLPRIGEVGDAAYSPITVDGKDYEYVRYGDDDSIPYELQRLLRMNMVAMRAQAFNVQCCYGQGIRFVDRETMKDTTDPEIREFCLRNSIHEVFMEQATDMKFFFWNVTVIILSRDHAKIVQMRHKDVTYCRFQRPDKNTGRIAHVFFGDFRKSMSPLEAEMIPLLDYWDPLGDLMARMGKAPDPYTGVTGKPPRDGHNCKFAIVSRIRHRASSSIPSHTTPPSSMMPGSTSTVS